MQKGKRSSMRLLKQYHSFITRGTHAFCPHWFKLRCRATKTQISLAHVPKEVSQKLKCLRKAKKGNINELSGWV